MEGGDLLDGLLVDLLVGGPEFASGRQSFKTVAFLRSKRVKLWLKKVFLEIPIF